jgi:hypothetical protein
VSLLDLAAELIADRELVAGPVALTRLIETFTAKHPDAAALVAAWNARPLDGSFADWYAAHRNDAALFDTMTDLALTALFGAVYVKKHVIDASDPAWAFVGRFWALIESHPLALSGGPFGHWRYGPGAR